MKVVNLRADAGSATKVDRSTKWGNPFRISRRRDRDEVIALYEDWIRNSHEAKHLRTSIRRGELNDCDLACWCAPQRCHADVLLKLVAEHGPK